MVAVAEYAVIISAGVRIVAVADGVNAAGGRIAAVVGTGDAVGA
jgi:hypothetical protein